MSERAFLTSESECFLRLQPLWERSRLRSSPPESRRVPSPSSSGLFCSIPRTPPADRDVSDQMLLVRTPWPPPEDERELSHTGGRKVLQRPTRARRFQFDVWSRSPFRFAGDWVGSRQGHCDGSGHGYSLSRFQPPATS